MIYIFENGRILYSSELLTEADNGKYIEVDVLPVIEPVDGKIGVITGCDLINKTIVVEYFDIPVPEPLPEPLPEPVPEPLPEPIPEPYHPTQGELMIMETQATIYEEMQSNNLVTMETQAELYETLLTLTGGTV